MNEALLKDLDSLENKLNFQEFLNSKINLNDLDSSDFDINVFFHKNFANKERDPLSLNYDKLKESLEFVLAIQKQTCEEIAVSVDLNLDKYVQISTKFGEMKDSLQNTEEIYSRLFGAIGSAKDSCKSNMFALEEVLDNYKLLDDIEANLRKLRKYVSRLQSLKETLESPSMEMFEFVEVCSSLKELKAFYSKHIKNGIKIRDIAEKNDLLGKTNEVLKLTQNKLESSFRGFLTEYGAALLEKAKASPEEIQDVLNEEKHAWRKKITLFLMCFSFIEKQATGEKLVAEVLMKPRFDAYLSQALSNKTNFIAATKRELQEKNLNLQKVPIRYFYDSVIRFINFELQPFLDVTLEKSSWKAQENCQYEYFVYEVEGYNFVKKVWDLLAQYLNLPEVGFIYGVGLADLFFVNYEVSIDFLTGIKQVLKDRGSKEQLEQLCTLESMKNFIGKWNISTYFHLRYNEIVRNFEQKQSLKISEIVSGKLPPEESQAPLTNILIASLESVFARGIFIKVIADKFIRLSFQLTNRFANILEENLTKLKDGQDSGPEVKEQSNSQRILLFIANDISNCSKVLEDKFMMYVIGALKKTEVSNLEKENQISFQDFAKNALSEVKRRLVSLMINYLQPSINQVHKQCNENLEPFNGITAKYRMSNKEAPSRPSNFTGNILRPLSSFLQNQKLDDGCQKLIKEGVIRALLTNYEKLVGSILQSSMKSEELMNKYITTKNDLGSVSGEHLTEFQKIQKQFKLDTIELLGIAEQKFEVSYSLKEINNLI